MTAADRSRARGRASSGDRPVDAMIRSGVLAGLVVAVVAGVVTVIGWGRPALWSGLTASAVTMGFFLLGLTGLKFVLSGAAGLSLAGAFVVYLGQLIVLVVVLVALRRSGFIEPMAFVLNAVAQALAWQVGLVMGFARARIPVVEGSPR